MAQQITASQVSRPIRSPVELDVGRLTARDAYQFGVLAVGSLAIAALGGLLARLAVPGPYGELSALRLVLLVFGLAVLVVAFGLAVIVCWLTVTDWLAYRQRLSDWHYAALSAYEAQDGREVAQTLTVTDLSSSLPLHVLAAALSVQRRMLQGEPNPFATRQLEGPLFLGGVRLGDVSPTTAEQLPRVFAQIGLIKGRGPRQAGEWTAKSEADVVKAVVDNWGKVSN